MREQRLTLVEFTDYQCPSALATSVTHCKSKKITSILENPHVVLDLPLEPIHSLRSGLKPPTAHAIPESYWEMHDRLFQNRQTLAQWTAHAQAVGIDIAKFEECLNSGKYAGEIRRDMDEARKAGVNRTPIFFLATTDPASSKVETITRLIGAQPYATFKAEIDRVLSEAVKTAPRDRQK